MRPDLTFFIVKLEKDSYMLKLIINTILLILVQEFIHKQLRECGAVLNGGTRDIGGQRDIIWNLIYQSSLHMATASGERK